MLRRLLAVCSIFVLLFASVNTIIANAENTISSLDDDPNDTDIFFKGIGLVRNETDGWYSIFVIGILPPLIGGIYIHVVLPGDKIGVNGAKILIHLFSNVYFVAGWLYG